MCSGDAALYRLAEDDGLIRRVNNPAAKVVIPRRLPSPRRALLNHELAAIHQVVQTTGNDVPLDCLLIRLHMETACRRGGALALRLRDLDTQSCAVRLREKGETVRWQPITPTSTAALTEHARVRGASEPTDALLRNRQRPSCRGRYRTVGPDGGDASACASSSGPGIGRVEDGLRALTGRRTPGGRSVSDGFASPGRPAWECCCSDSIRPVSFATDRT
jgi:integrase